jgi:prepilin-type N-terminal cleavage/methylation domain-containing protein
VTRRARGFSLVEVLVAAAVIAVGFAGLAGALAASSASVRDGRYRSAAVALAVERSEQLRAAQWDADGDCLGLSPAPSLPPLTDGCPGRGAAHSPFPDERAGALAPPFEQFSRVARVLSCATGACPVASPDLRLVTVGVSYPPLPGSGGGPGNEQSVAVTRLVSRRW